MSYENGDASVPTYSGWGASGRGHRHPRSVICRRERDTELAPTRIGAAMGNMICISNIVAVATVINLANRVDFILKRAVMPFLVYALVAGLVGLAAAWLRTG